MILNCALIYVAISYNVITVRYSYSFKEIPY